MIDRTAAVPFRLGLPLALAAGLALVAFAGCAGDAGDAPAPGDRAGVGAAVDDAMEARLAKYTPVRLTADLDALSDAQRRMIPLLIEAAEAMDDAFWTQAYGDKQSLLTGIVDPDTRRFAEINYGPWDRLAGNEPFIEGVGPKPAGANYYPADMSPEEFETAAADAEDGGETLKSLYTMIRRDDAGGLVAVPYSEFFPGPTSFAAGRLRDAAALAEDAGFRKYLELRADALESDSYRESDLAWMDMKSNAIDVVIGPIETYEDQLFGQKAAFEAYVLIKDREWSERLARYADLLPELQRGLPVDAAYKTETPGTDSDLNAYDVVYYAGDCNAGSKTIAINLPNDETVQLEKGTRRLQLKNAMRAKFDKILVPISEVLIADDQRQHIRFDSFFANTMFHEVAHGLGIKNTVDGAGTVREALKEHASAMEEGKADVLGLYMITEMRKRGEWTTGSLEDDYVTFLASIFRSVRFGAASAHGKANMIRFNFFEEMGAFRRDEATGTYRVDFDRMQEAVDALSRKILTYQGDGDYDGVATFVGEQAVVGDGLQSDLDRLSAAGIPVDVTFEQGVDVLGL